MIVTGWLPHGVPTTKDLIQLRFTTEKKDHSSNWKTVAPRLGQLEQRYLEPDIRQSNEMNHYERFSFCLGKDKTAVK